MNVPGDFEARDKLGDMVARIEDVQTQDAAAFAAHDEYLCMLCHAEGQDKRSLFIDCLYNVKEVVPEALAIRKAGLVRGQGYYLRLCKSCRGSLLDMMQGWANERRTLRSVPKDHDGGLLEVSEDRNIPVRINGRIQMLNAEEFEAYRRGLDGTVT